MLGVYFLQQIQCSPELGKESVFIGPCMEETGHWHAIAQPPESMLVPSILGKRPGSNKKRQQDKGSGFKERNSLADSSVRLC